VGVHTWSFSTTGELGIAGNLASNDVGAINFIANSSGDGNGYSTMQLIPDLTLMGTDQYLIIDPTAPDHIHIRAGGAQDNSSTELILGGEASYFKVGSGSNPTVYIKSDNKQWNFGTDGNLTMPTGGNLIFDSSAVSVIDGVTSIVFADSTAQTSAYGNTQVAEYLANFDGTINFTASPATISTGEITAANVSSTNGFFWGNGTPYSTGGGTLTVNDSGLTITGGTGTIYQGPTGVLQGGDKKGGVYHAASTSSNGLFTFGINGGGIMSAAVEGSLFVGTTLPSNNGGVTTAYGGWLVVENGGKFGTDLDTLGNMIIGKGVFEKFQAKQDATGTVEHDCLNGHIFYHTSPDANWTANFTNLNIATGYATSITIVITQGGTGYYPNVVQIGGVAQTINWQGNATPTPSTNRTDVVTFSILNNSGTYIVLGQLTGF
jgi:hypothetical protein